MSLIVAKKFNDKIVIVSDTRLDNPDNLNHVELLAPAEFSMIKTVIINPHICISFAGEVEPVKETIRVSHGLGYRIQDILNHLLTVNHTTCHKTEFIVGVSLPPFFVYEIKDGKISQAASSWIGMREGFNIFQEHFQTSLSKSLEGQIEASMKAVIESNVVGVNGFLVEVNNNSGVFEYKNFVSAYIPERSYGAGVNVIGYGTAQEGGYTVHTFPSRMNILPIHIPQNRMGFIFRPKGSCLLEPDIYRDVDEHEFAEITHAKYGINPGYVISSKQKSFFERGNKEAEKKDFKKAILLYEQGLQETEAALKPQLHFNIAVCCYHLAQFEEGARHFVMATKLNNSLQGQVYQFISRFSKK